MIVIVDYGMGNLRSVQKGLAKAGFEAIISADPEVVGGARGLVLPGVGAFGDAMTNLAEQGLDQAIRRFAGSGRPFLGICLGLQLMFESSEENGWHAGLGLLQGRVVRLPEGLKIPHMGWNALRQLRTEPVLAGIPEETYFYFVHSYYVQPTDPAVVAAVTDYGLEVPAVVSRDNLIGIQFHPEKSSAWGLRILKNFGELVGNAGYTRD